MARTKKRSLLSRLSGPGFHWTGRTKKGVSRWEGTWDNLPRWFTYGFLGYGAIAGLVALIAALRLLWLGGGSDDAEAFPFVFGLHSLIFLVSGFLMERQRRRIASLTPEEEVCAQLGVEPEQLERMAEEKKIKPVYNINGQDMYNLRDFNEALNLLRASEAPVEPDTLLRPVEYTGETRENELLRPVEERETRETPRWNVPAEEETEQQIQRGV